MHHLAADVELANDRRYVGRDTKQLMMGRIDLLECNFQ
jgi:hypothetical protein